MIPNSSLKLKIFPFHLGDVLPLPPSAERPLCQIYVLRQHACRTDRRRYSNSHLQIRRLASTTQPSPHQRRSRWGRGWFGCDACQVATSNDDVVRRHTIVSECRLWILRNIRIFVFLFEMLFQVEAEIERGYVEIKVPNVLRIYRSKPNGHEMSQRWRWLTINND